MRVNCSISESIMQGDYGEVNGVEATCGRCGHVTASYGTGDGSIRRCLVLMREECPRGESHYYTDGGSL